MTKWFVTGILPEDRFRLTPMPDALAATWPPVAVDAIVCSAENLKPNDEYSR